MRREWHFAEFEAHGEFHAVSKGIGSERYVRNNAGKLILRRSREVGIAACEIVYVAVTAELVAETAEGQASAAEVEIDGLLVVFGVLRSLSAERGIVLAALSL